LVLVGRTGSGKSSLGNSLLCPSGSEKPFKSEKSANSITTQCQLARAILKDGTLLTIVDTPGLFNIYTPNEITIKKIVKSKTICAPGPHVIVFVLDLKRFIIEEIETMEILKKLFGTDAMKHIIVVITGKDK
ncbi:hypothetical protein LOTGIDRAFT_78964, partial [Lottia gigantea]